MSTFLIVLIYSWHHESALFLFQEDEWITYY